MPFPIPNDEPAPGYCSSEDYLAPLSPSLTHSEKMSLHIPDYGPSPYHWPQGYFPPTDPRPRGRLSGPGRGLLDPRISHQNDPIIILHNGVTHKLEFPPYIINDRKLCINDLHAKATEQTGTSVSSTTLMQNDQVLGPPDSTLWYHHIASGDTVCLVESNSVQLQKLEYEVREAELKERDPRHSLQEGNSARRRLRELKEAMRRKEMEEGGGGVEGTVREHPD